MIGRCLDIVGSTLSFVEQTSDFEIFIGQSQLIALMQQVVMEYLEEISLIAWARNIMIPSFIVDLVLCNNHNVSLRFLQTLLRHFPYMPSLRTLHISPVTIGVNELVNEMTKECLSLIGINVEYVKETEHTFDFIIYNETKITEIKRTVLKYRTEDEIITWINQLPTSATEISIVGNNNVGIRAVEVIFLRLIISMHSLGTILIAPVRTTNGEYRSEIVTRCIEAIGIDLETIKLTTDKMDIIADTPDKVKIIRETGMKYLNETDIVSWAQLLPNSTSHIVVVENKYITLNALDLIFRCITKMPLLQKLHIAPFIITGSSSKLVVDCLDVIGIDLSSQAKTTTAQMCVTSDETISKIREVALKYVSEEEVTAWTRSLELTPSIEQICLLGNQNIGLGGLEAILRAIYKLNSLHKIHIAPVKLGTYNYCNDIVKDSLDTIGLNTEIIRHLKGTISVKILDCDDVRKVQIVVRKHIDNEERAMLSWTS